MKNLRVLIEMAFQEFTSYSARDADTHNRVYPSMEVKEVPNVYSSC